MTDGNALAVMAWLVPAIYAARLIDRLLVGLDGVDARDKPGHD